MIYLSLCSKGSMCYTSNFSIKWENAPAAYGAFFGGVGKLAHFYFAFGVFPLMLIVRLVQQMPSVHRPCGLPVLRQSAHHPGVRALGRAGACDMLRPSLTANTARRLNMAQALQTVPRTAQQLRTAKAVRFFSCACLTSRSRGRSHSCSPCVGQAGAPYLLS